mgnify:CR=1 FL=1
MEVLAKKLIVFDVAVAPIADDGVPQVGTVATNLVPPPGFRTQAQQAVAGRIVRPYRMVDLSLGQAFVMGNGPLFFPLRFRGERIINRTALLQIPADQSQVVFAYVLLAELMGQTFRSRRASRC